MTRGSRQPDPSCPLAPLLVALVCFVLVLPVAAADKREDAEGQLSRLRERIGTLRDELGQTQGEYDVARSELAKLETRIGDTSRRLAELDREMEEQGRKVQNFGADRQRIEAEIAVQQRGLAADVRAAYAVGRQDRLRLLLNQQDPARVDRVMVYYEYLHRERTRRIDELSALHRDLDGVRRNAAGATARLAAMREEELARKQALEADRTARHDLLLRVKAELGNKDRELKRLLKDEKEFENLVERLSRVLEDIPADVGQSFARRRGTLIRPLDGPVVTEFGTRRPVGEMVWQGIVIGGREGAPVRAVAPGRVAYAEWLRGYGLMLILDHGDGFMSLYGYNQALHRAVGDWVDAGGTIASVGNSGGQERSGLYFEIRQKGKPLDPAGWLRRSAR